MFSSKSKRFSWDWWKRRQTIRAQKQLPVVVPGQRKTPSWQKLKYNHLVSLSGRRITHTAIQTNSGEGKGNTVQHFSTASDEDHGGCTGWCQRPNATPGTGTKSVHWDKHSGYKWHFKSTNQWHTTCQLWASHVCHCIPTSCSYSCLLFASWEDLQSQPAVLRVT